MFFYSTSCLLWIVQHRAMTFLESVSLLQSSVVQVPIWYALILASMLTLWLLVRLITKTLRALLILTTFLFLKYCLYPHFFRRFTSLGTRFQALIWMLYTAINIGCVVFGARSKSDISSRSATMSVINVIPLLCGPRLSMTMKLLGITLRTQHLSHRWFGSTAAIEALLHSILSLQLQSASFQWTKVDLSGVVVCPILH
jgi:hypothetical protein